MKRITYVRPILFALVTLSAFACSDNVVTPSSPGPVQTKHELSLVPSKWETQRPGYFVSGFGNVAGINVSSQYAVYLVRNNVKTLISSGAIEYEGGNLWAQTIQGNLSIIYDREGSSAQMSYNFLGSMELLVVY